MGRWVPQLLVLASICAFATACSKREPGSPSTASVRFALPASQGKVSSLTNNEITRIMINVTGSGVDPARVWFCDHSENACPQNGGAISIEVPSGSARMIQVLVVMKNETAETIYYGDVTKDLSSAEESVSVDVSSIGVSSAHDIKAIGRYKDSSGQYPTSNLNLRFSPGGGKPSMVVEHGQMVAGYINLFFREGINLQWEFANGGVNGGVVNLSELSLATLPTRVTKIQVPAHYYCSSTGTNCGSDRQPDTYLYVGLFGPGQSTSYACYNSFELITNLWVNNNATGQLSWATGTLGTYDIGPLSGGTSSSTPCSAGSAFIDRVMVQGAQIGKEETAVASMSGAYINSSGSSMNWTHSSGPLSLSANYLPGIVSAGAVTATDIFYKNSTDPSAVINHDKKIVCSQLQTNLGYSLLTHTETSAAVSATIATSAAAGSLPTDLSVVFCPFRLNADGSKTYFDGLAIHRNEIPQIANITPTVFSTVGVQTYTIPSSCNQVEIKAWGGGGGGGSGISSNPGGPGGGGGFVTGRFPSVPGQMWTIGVGGAAAGGSGTANTPSPGGSIGGGAGTSSDSAGSSAGGGGGVTYVLNSNAQVLLAAGGGGGGGAGNITTPGGKGGSGGGNGTSAGDGGGLYFGYGAYVGSPGAYQNLGGEGRPLGYNGNPYGEGGSAVTASAGYAGGGGGGAGYQGGASGSPNNASQGGGGGGGGSNFIETTIATSSGLAYGTGALAANAADPDRLSFCSSCAQGGSAGSNASPGQPGTPGLVVLRCLP